MSAIFKVFYHLVFLFSPYLLFPNCFITKLMRNRYLLIIIVKIIVVFESLENDDSLLGSINRIMVDLSTIAIVTI